MSLEQARLLIAVKRWDAAREALAPSLADPATGSQPWCLLAQLELAAGRPGYAAQAAQRALSIDPSREVAIRLLALAQLSQKRLHEAETTARQGMALAPHLPEMVYVMVTVLLARRRLREAEDLAAQNLRAHPERAVAWETAARVSLHRERWTEAEERARRALALEPQDADVMMMLAVALQARGQRREAGQLYAAVSRLDPADQRGREALGELGLGVSFRRHPAGLRYVFLLLPQVWLGLLLGLAVLSFRQWRARAVLEPQLRAVVRRQQRAAAGTRLFTVGLASLTLSILWFGARQWIPAIVLAAAGILHLVVWRWWAPQQARRWAESLRNRFH